MSEARLKLLKLFDKIESIQEIARNLEEPAERELLTRASVLRYFDETVFNQYLKANLPEPDATQNSPQNDPASFENFVKNLNVEPVPRSLGIYSLKEEARLPYIGQLLSDRSTESKTWRDKKEVFQRLVEYYEKEGPEFDLDRLAVLAVINPQEAREEFEKLYSEADERFDLARCNDLLRTLEIRTQLLTEELKNLCHSKRQYYNARNLYITDYYKTNTYLARASMSEDFELLLAMPFAKGQKWIFHVYATGGLGKTMFVRWLISRDCVPEPRRIPVARLDFDPPFDLNYVSRYPLLLLLEIADQLNKQIAQRPFSEIFSSMWKYKELLNIPTSADTAKRIDLETSFQSIEPSWSLTALKEFSRTLKEAKFDKPIVIALDTVEEMLLINRDSLVKVIRQIEEIHNAYPALRLVLSGRYDLRDQLDGLTALFDKETIPYELTRFTTSEAETYLRDKRGLTKAPFIEAIIEKCADEKEHTINPFILSLMTDLVTSKDIETVEEIRKYPRAEVAYMIQRIIQRIKDFDVRWMLRYAVIPRILTLDVLENVMWGHLVAERGKQRGKDLSGQSNGEKGFDQKEYWPYGEASTAKAAWEKLTPFVSSFGWVSFDATDDSRLRLHSEVVVPMRFLLAKEEIFPLLHKGAAEYFVKKANDQPKKWAVWMSEAIYHRFQLEGPKASSFWRQQLDGKQTQTDMDARRQLAFEITRRDYVDENEVPLKWPDDQARGAIVTAEDLCRAHQEVAVASIMLAAKNKQKTEKYAAEWDQARQHLLKLDALLKGDNRPTYEPAFDMGTYTKLASELNKTLIDYDIVIPLMESALHSTRGVFLPLGLKIQLAEMHASLNSRNAEKYFREAREESKFLKIPFLSPSRIQLKLARWYQDQKRFKEALAEYEDALAGAEKRNAQAVVRNIMFRMAEVSREIGLYTAAESLSQELQQRVQSIPSKTDEKFDYTILFSSIQARDLYRPLIGLRTSEALLELVDNARKHAAVAELRGCALGQLMEFKDAPSVLEQAKELWSHVVDPFGPDRARMYRVELQLNQIGNVNEADALLDAWKTQGEKRDAELTTQMELLRVRCLYLQDELEAALEKWRNLLVEYINSPRSMVRILSTGLALGFGDDETLKRLLDVLKGIEPPSARLPLLTAFRFAESREQADSVMPEYHKLIKLIEWPVEKRESVSSALMFADVLRFCGSSPRDLLERAINKSLTQNEIFAYIQLLSALNRSGIHSSPDANIYRSSFLEEYQQHRTLCCAALLEQAERELESGELDKCETTLTDARDNYSEPDSTTKWTAFSKELTGRLEQRRGDEGKAAAHLTAALSIYERLGDKHATRRIRNQFPETAGIKNEEYQRFGQPEGTYTMRLENVDNSIVVTSEIITVRRKKGSSQSGNAKFTRRFPQSEFSNQITASLRDRQAIFDLTRRITQDFEGFRRELGELLVSSKEMDSLRRLGKEPEALLDARLELPPAAAKIPVELALVAEQTSLSSLFRYFYRGTSNDLGQTETIKWIQLATNILTREKLIVDGLVGSSTLGLLNHIGIPAERLTIGEIRESLGDRLQKQRGSSRLRALVISPSFETHIAKQRGSDTGGFSLRYLYDELDFDVTTIDVHRPERLAEELAAAIATFRPQLVHIESSFMEDPHAGQVYLDFNIERNSYGSDKSNYAPGLASDYLQLSTTLLNDALFKLPDSMLRPLLILEAQSVPGVSATVQQLLLRNTFASELFRLGNTSGVVAIGLSSYPSDRITMLKSLAHKLSTGECLGNVVNVMNQRSYEISKGETDLIQSPVLFTDNPSFTLLPME